MKAWDELLEDRLSHTPSAPWLRTGAVTGTLLMYTEEGVRLNGPISCPSLKYFSGLCMPGLFCLLSTRSRLSKEIGMKLSFLPLLRALNLALFFLFSFLHFFFNSHPRLFYRSCKKHRLWKAEGKGCFQAEERVSGCVCGLSSTRGDPILNMFVGCITPQRPEWSPPGTTVM